MLLKAIGHGVEGPRRFGLHREGQLDQLQLFPEVHPAADLYLPAGSPQEEVLPQGAALIGRLHPDPGPQGTCLHHGNLGLGEFSLHPVKDIDAVGPGVGLAVVNDQGFSQSTGSQLPILFFIIEADHSPGEGVKGELEVLVFQGEVLSLGGVGQGGVKLLVLEDVVQGPAVSGELSLKQSVVLVPKVGLRAAHLLAGDGLSLMVAYTFDSGVQLHGSFHREGVGVEHHQGRALTVPLPENDGLFLTGGLAQPSGGLDVPGQPVEGLLSHLAGLILDGGQSS